MSKRSKNSYKDKNGKMAYWGKALSHGTHRKKRKPNSRFVKAGLG